MELYLIRHGQSANNLRKQALAEHPGTAPAAAAPRMADPPLTDLGELQARLAGESLRDEGITTLYCGPMLRTLQTAQIVGAVLDLSPHVFVGLHEWGGVWEPRDDGNSVQLPGLTRREMSTMFPGCVLPADVTDRGWWFHDWEGDRAMLDLAHRNALSFIAHLETHHVAAEQRIALAEGYRAATGMGMETHHVAAEQRIAAILHGGSGSSLVSALFGIPIPAKWERGLNVETASRYARFTHDNAGVSRISITPERRQLRYLNRIDHLNDTALQS